MESSSRKPGRPRDEQLTERRRAEILEAAARMFADRGYRQTDLQVLADQIGIGKGTIYRYFPTKEELFLAAADHGIQLLHCAMAETGQEQEPLERVAGAISCYLAFFDQHPEFIELLVQERAEFKDRQKPTYFAHKHEQLEPWQNLLRRLINEGRARRVPVERAIEVVSDLLYGTIFTNYFAGRTKTLEVQAKDILDLILFGLLSESERGARVGGLEQSSNEEAES